MNLLKKDEPLWMPAGSVRSILALGVVSAFIAGWVEIEVATLVLGFYFASRQSSEVRDDEEAHSHDE